MATALQDCLMESRLLSYPKNENQTHLFRDFSASRPSLSPLASNIEVTDTSQLQIFSIVDLCHCSFFCGIWLTHGSMLLGRLLDHSDHTQSPKTRCWCLFLWDPAKISKAPIKPKQLQGCWKATPSHWKRNLLEWIAVTNFFKSRFQKIPYQL